MIELMTLSGRRGVLNINPQELSDRDAGLYALAMLARFYPGQTMKEIFTDSPELSGWLGDAWRGLKSGVGDVKDGIGDTIRDVGHAGGDLWRGFWSSEPGQVVTDTARSKLGLAPVDRDMDKILAQLGQGVKGFAGKLPGGGLVWAGGALALIVLVMVLK